MAIIKATPKTIHDIHFQLGSPEQYEVGYQAQGHVTGQIIDNKIEGVESHKPETFDFMAEVREKKDKKVWYVINLKAHHINPRDTLTWQEDY